MVVIGIILCLVMVVIGINPHRLSPSRYGTIILLSSRIWTATSVHESKPGQTFPHQYLRLVLAKPQRRQQRCQQQRRQQRCQPQRRQQRCQPQRFTCTLIYAPGANFYFAYKSRVHLVSTIPSIAPFSRDHYVPPELAIQRIRSSRSDIFLAL